MKQRNIKQQNENEYLNPKLTMLKHRKLSRIKLLEIYHFPWKEILEKGCCHKNSDSNQLNLPMRKICMKECNAEYNLAKAFLDFINSS